MHLTVVQWLREGLRAAFFLRPRVAGAAPSPSQLLLIGAGCSLLLAGAARLEVPGAASFDLRAWLMSWWGTAAMVLLVWWALTPVRSAQAEEGDTPPVAAGSRVAAWFALWFAALLPAELVAHAMGIAQVHGALPKAVTTQPWLAWSIYLLLTGWFIAIGLRLAWHLGATRPRLGVLMLGLASVFAVSVWQFPDRWWNADQSELADAPRLQLSQEVFEAQQALWRQTVEAIGPGRPGVANVWGLVFAPYAGEDVFLRESELAAQVLRERFDAKDRVVQLVNHANTARSRLWATPLNLKRAITALAQRMDRDNDVLVLYMTSHGASDFRLAASHWPLEVPPLTPQELRQALDDAGVKNRVLVISACYSGGWVEPLAGDSTLVMTAADAVNTSYGCGRLSELTFFGRALWDEQLRTTHSFEQAFARAVPVIRQRETDAGKSDGFSNPQIRLGAALAPVLKALEQRLGGS